MYSPYQNTFITIGDAIFCEHVGRPEPEMLLPPITEVDLSKPLNPVDYQQLVDTVHYYEKEGGNCRVLNVYTSRGLIIVDRELFDTPNQKRRITDAIHLGDALGMPIMAGGVNPKYKSSSSTSNVRFATDTSSPERRPEPTKQGEATSGEIKARLSASSRPEAQRVNATSGKSTRSSDRIRDENPS
jgi:hypothetical protein